MARAVWTVEFHPDCESWADGLAPGRQGGAVGCKAILLVGGDKSADWKDWYQMNIPIADDRLDAHQRFVGKQRVRNLARRQAAEGS